MKKLLRYLCKILACLATLALISLIIFLVWIFIAPRNVPFISHHLRTIAASSYPDITINSSLTLASINKDYNIELCVNYLEAKHSNDRIFSADNLSIEVDIIDIFRKKRFISSLKMRNFFLNIDYDKIISSSKNEVLADDIYKLFSHNMNLENGTVLIHRNSQDINWRINNITLASSMNKFILNLDSAYEDKLSSFNVQGIFAHKEIQVNSNFTNIPLFVFENLEITKPIFKSFNLGNMNLLLNGENSFSLNKHGEIENAKLKLSIDHSNLKSTQSTERESTTNYPLMDLLSLKTEIEIADKGTNYLLKNIDLNFTNNSNISANGSLVRKKNQKNIFNNDIQNIKAKCLVKNIAIDNVKHIWPESFQTEVRQWVIQNITYGNITYGEGVFEFDEDFFQKEILKQQSIKASIQTEGVQLVYYPEYPNIKNISAEVLFDGKKLVATSNKAIINDSKIKYAKVEVPYILDKITINGDLTGPIANYSNFIPNDILSTINSYKIDIPNINNIANSNIKLQIPITENIDSKSIMIEIASQTHNLTLSNSLKSYPLTNTNFFLKNSEGSISVKADGLYKKMPITATFINNYSVNEPSKFLLNANMDKEFLQEIGIDNHINISDESHIPITAQINHDSIEYSSDLTNMPLFIPKFGYSKNSGTNLNLTMQSRLVDNKLNFENIVLQGKNADVKGNIVINSNTNIVTECNLKIAKLDNNSNVNINFSNNNNLKKTTIKAKYVDLVKADFKSILGGKNVAGENKIILLNIDKIAMKNDEFLTSVKLNYNCLSDFTCKDINLTSNIAGTNHFNINLTKNPNNEIIKITSDNGSAFLRAFGFYKNFKKGNIEIVAKKEVKKAENGRKFINISGYFSMKDYAITQQSFISKLILNLTSLPGILNMFTGNSIKMDSYDSIINYEDGILSIDGKMKGPSIEILLAGKIDTDNDIIKLKGSIIPSIYGINSNISKIPLLGKILSGGDEGVISANYTVTGSTQNADVKINPISLLPLSFFKKIFE